MWGGGGERLSEWEREREKIHTNMTRFWWCLRSSCQSGWVPGSFYTDEEDWITTGYFSLKCSADVGKKSPWKGQMCILKCMQKDEASGRHSNETVFQRNNIPILPNPRNKWKTPSKQNLPPQLTSLLDDMHTLNVLEETIQ